MPEKEETKDDGSVYDQDGREDMIDDDEISPEEEAFMKGYDEAEEEEEPEAKEEGEEEVEE